MRWSNTSPSYAIGWLPETEKDEVSGMQTYVPENGSGLESEKDEHYRHNHFNTKMQHPTSQSFVNFFQNANV